MASLPTPPSTPRSTPPSAIPTDPFEPAIGGRAVQGTGRRLACSAALVALCGSIVGCETDSFLDPSVVGRWENTPTIVPILERIDVIEHDTNQFVDVTPVNAEDLIPEPTDYRLGAGDRVDVDILDFIVPGQSQKFERVVSANGYLDLPQLDPIPVIGRTRSQTEELIVRAIRDAGLLDEPLVTVQIPGQRQSTFSVFGAIDRPGTYPILEPDYRILRALTDAGGVSPLIPKVFIIRQVSIAEPRAFGPEGQGAGAEPKPQTTQPTEPPKDQGPNLIDLIDELTTPPTPPPPPTTTPPPTTPPHAPETHPTSPPPPPSSSPQRDEALGMGALGGPVSGSMRQVALANTRVALGAQASMSAMQDGQAPPIDLVEEPEKKPATSSPQLPAAPTPGRWVFLNGEWVQTLRNAPIPEGGLPDSGPAPLLNEPAGALVTQRVIEVPVEPLLQGVAKFNVIVRPGDVISVPGPSQGLVYASGPGIARAGVYQLPAAGKLTLMRLVASAGGLSAIAIPERVDLTRIVGDSRQATIRVNLKAIYEGTQPDLLLKPDDLINVGTNFWATPLAVLRGGLRASYGFGFLLDRNFGNDVFGAPPTNQFGQ